MKMSAPTVMRGLLARLIANAKETVFVRKVDVLVLRLLIRTAFLHAMAKSVEMMDVKVPAELA